MSHYANVPLAEVSRGPVRMHLDQAVAAIRQHGFDCYTTSAGKLYGILPYADKYGFVGLEHVEVEPTLSGVRKFLGY